MSISVYAVKIQSTEGADTKLSRLVFQFS